MKDLLTDLLEYMESRADADIEGPNKEMGFQIRIEEALAKMEKPRFPHMETHEIFDLPAPNTVMWWLCRIADDEVRRKAVEAFEKFPLYPEYKTTTNTFNVKSAIDAIDWGECDFVFWEKVYYSNPELLPTPEWKEYLELRK